MADFHSFFAGIRKKLVREAEETTALSPEVRAPQGKQPLFSRHRPKQPFALAVLFTTLKLLVFAFVVICFAGLGIAFGIGKAYIETAPELLRRMAEEGHLVGNHTYHHYDMSKIGDMPSFQAEMTAVEQAYEKTVGQPMPRLYRPPQGKYSEQNLKMAQQLGYRTYFWSLAYVDWYVDNQPTKEQAFAKLLPRVHNGAIILLHSTSATNAQILDELLTRFEEMGYRFGKLTDLSAQSTGA